MSLQLREISQEILDKFELQEFHVRVSIHGTLMLVSQCGKPFITIPGIKFAKSVPNRAELPIAAKLLSKFLVKHGDDLNKVLELKAKLELLEYKLENDKTFKSIRYKHITFDSIRHINTENGCYTLKYVTDEFEITSNTLCVQYTVKDVFNNTILSKVKISKIVDVIEAFRIQAASISAVGVEHSKLLEKLTSCDI